MTTFKTAVFMMILLSKPLIVSQYSVELYQLGAISPTYLTKLTRIRLCGEMSDRFMP